eukprot:scaffold29698_cov30-Prasinocladus_malaysianus.AAC.2
MAWLSLSRYMKYIMTEPFIGNTEFVSLRLNLDRELWANWRVDRAMTHAGGYILELKGRYVYRTKGYVS